MAQSAELIATLTGHTDMIRCSAASRNNRFLVSSSHDRKLKIWRMDTWELVQTLEGHSGSIRSVAISPNCRFIASSGYDSSIQLWV